MVYIVNRCDGLHNFCQTWRIPMGSICFWVYKSNLFWAVLWLSLRLKRNYLYPSINFDIFKQIKDLMLMIECYKIKYKINSVWKWVTLKRNSHVKFCFVQRFFHIRTKRMSQINTRERWMGPRAKNQITHNIIWIKITLFTLFPCYMSRLENTVQCFRVYTLCVCVGSSYSRNNNVYGRKFDVWNHLFIDINWW